MFKDSEKKPELIRKAIQLRNENYNKAINQNKKVPCVLHLGYSFHSSIQVVGTAGSYKILLEFNHSHI